MVFLKIFEILPGPKKRVSSQSIRKKSNILFHFYPTYFYFETFGNVKGFGKAVHVAEEKSYKLSACCQWGYSV